MTNAVYSKFAKPFLPYLETPAAYAKPYALKIDEYGNIFLDKVDEKVPVLKAETEEVKSTVIGYINWPLEKAGETKSYVLDLYNSEYKKCGGDGLVAGGKAVITSSLVLTSDTLHWLSQFLAAKKAEAEDYAKDAEGKLRKAAKDAEDKFNQTVKDAEGKYQQLAKDAEAKKDEAVSEAKEKTDS